MTASLVTFDPDGKLYILSLRGDTIVLEQATREDDYLPAQIEFEEVTRAQVAARPWLRVDPQSGELFLSFDAQEGDMLFTTPSLIRSDDGVNWSLTSRADQHVSVVDIFSPRATGPDDIQVLFGQGITCPWCGCGTRSPGPGRVRSGWQIPVITGLLSGCQLR
jgi:hypothetical protein